MKRSIRIFWLLFLFGVLGFVVILLLANFGFFATVDGIGGEG